MDFVQPTRINGAFIESRILQTAVLLGIFDALGDGATSIHGEDEAANQRLRRRGAAALQSGGRIVIKDHILEADLTSPAVGAVFSVQMLPFTRGRDYSFDEVRAWLQQAGLTDIAQWRLAPPLTFSLVTAGQP